MEVEIIHSITTDQKVVAFTFDDGPNPIYTPQILDIFHEVLGKATFFMIGEQMIKYPEVVKSVIEQKHEIGNHTYTHPFLTQLTIADCQKELTKTEKLIHKMVGVKPTTFRPPYFDYNDQVDLLCKKLGYRTIGAVNVDAKDWEQPGVNHIVTKTQNQIKNGSILLFHDGFEDRSQTVEAVRILVSDLVAKGYKLVTVSELFQMEKS